MAEEVNRGLERHLQTGIQGILILLCSWMAMTVQSTSVQVATLTERVSGLQEQVRQFEQAANDRYTRTDHNRDAAHTKSLIDDLRSRIRVLETLERGQSTKK